MPSWAGYSRNVEFGSSHGDGLYHVSRFEEFCGYKILLKDDEQRPSSIRINRFNRLNGRKFNSEDLSFIDTSGNKIDNPEITPYFKGKIVDGPFKDQILVIVSKNIKKTNTMRAWERVLNLVIPLNNIILKNGQPINVTFNERVDDYDLHI